ncbi:hypothetical protein G4V62_05635 [Bacillaceae bacterium SIJ1]|uniref:hypothetical protein n=1 Tax=Litoribacterium kuwaitense TaxID=1398745 RepID=UPI0013E9FEE7|nr:hypothetical protein [Litoribacterium kuwaitense]NGP44463.1 hypothetical protein [Litoribacterium kuwaitense]
MNKAFQEEKVRLEAVLHVIAKQHKAIYEELEAYRADLQMDRKHFGMGCQLIIQAGKARWKLLSKFAQKQLSSSGLKIRIGKKGMPM